MVKATEKYVNDRFKVFAKELGLEFFEYSGIVVGTIKPCHIPKDDYSVNMVLSLRDDIRLLLEYLELEMQSGKRVVKIKKAKK